VEGDIWAINSPETLENTIRQIRQDYEKNGFLSVKIEVNKTRTLSQNRAMNLYCKWLAEALNDAGYDMLKTLDKGAEIPWTGPSVKELMWREVQKAMTGKKSTTKPSKAEYIDIYEALNRHISSKFGVTVPWPNRGM